MAVSFSNSFETLGEKLSYQLPAAARIGRHSANDIEVAEGQTVYVPVYSHIYAGGGKPHLLETTLGLRNAVPKRPLSLKSVRYFDTDGALVKEYRGEEMALDALVAVEFLVVKRNIRGGSGANFIVVWDADGPVCEPLIEAVMVDFPMPTVSRLPAPGAP